MHVYGRMNDFVDANSSNERIAKRVFEATECKIKGPGSHDVQLTPNDIINYQKKATTVVSWVVKRSCLAARVVFTELMFGLRASQYNRGAAHSVRQEREMNTSDYLSVPLNLGYFGARRYLSLIHLNMTKLPPHLIISTKMQSYIESNCGS